LFQTLHGTAFYAGLIGYGAEFRPGVAPQEEMALRIALLLGATGPLGLLQHLLVLVLAHLLAPLLDD
jgi:hypothetical protein